MSMTLPTIHQALKEVFGFESFRSLQKDIIENVMSGKDTLAIMPTGGGKSLCYQVPAIASEGTAIVVSPLISLMQDQVANLQQYGVKSAFWNSTLTPSQKQDVEEKLLSGELKLLYVAPEGLLTASTLRLLSKIKVSLIAIDEAHCVSQWGHEFRVDYTRLNELRSKFPDVPRLALTATADAKTREDISEQLNLDEPKEFIASFDRPNIRYMIYERENEIKQLDQFIKDNHKGDCGIVYCLTRKKVESVTENLKELGYNAVAYHAGLSAQKRERNQDRFKTEEGIVVVATIAFGMGIDRPDVRYVAHLDLPKSIEGYYQETGRAGRDGQPASAWMVYGLQDVVKLSQMLELTQASEEYKKKARVKLNTTLTLCEIMTCRRRFLLDYFNEDYGKDCGNCDACLEKPEKWDATVPAQKLLSTIYRTGQNFGSGHLIDVLRGSKNARVMERGHDQLSVYGIGKDMAKPEWDSIVRQLIYLGYIRIKDYEYRNLALTESARPLLKGEETLHLRKTKRKGSPASSRRTTRPIEVEHGREDLFENLRELRREIAAELAVPPYIVFSDKSLHDMCAILPRNNDQFLMVHGVGASKAEKFSERFIQKIESYCSH